MSYYHHDSIKGRKKKHVRTNKFTVAAYPKVFDRILASVGCKTYIELADALNRSPSTIYSAYKNRTIPFTWLSVLHDKFGLKELYLLTGAGTKYCEYIIGKKPFIRSMKTTELIKELASRGYTVIK